MTKGFSSYEADVLNTIQLVEKPNQCWLELQFLLYKLTLLVLCGFSSFTVDGF